MVRRGTRRSIKRYVGYFSCPVLYLSPLLVLEALVLQPTQRKCSLTAPHLSCTVSFMFCPTSVTWPKLASLQHPSWHSSMILPWKYMGANAPWRAKVKRKMLPLLSPGWIVSCHVLITSSEGFGLPWWLSGKESACNADARDAGSIPGLGRSLGEGNGNPLQYFCLENPMDRGAQQAIIHGVARVGQDLVTKPPPPILCCTRSLLDALMTSHNVLGPHYRPFVN